MSSETKLPEDGYEWVEDILSHATEGEWRFKKSNRSLAVFNPYNIQVNNLFVLNEDQQSDISILMNQLQTKTLVVNGGKRR